MTAKEILEPFIDVAAIKDNDKFLFQATNTNNDSTEAQTAVRLTAAVVKAYLAKGLVDVTEDGYIIVNGNVTGSNISTPKFRRGTTGLEVSVDNGKTWNTVILWSEVSYRQPIIEQTSTDVTIYPNILNRWGIVSRLTIKLGAGNPVEVSEYMIQFSTGQNSVLIELPENVKWTETPEFEENHTYQVSILNNLAVYAGWEDNQ